MIEGAPARLVLAANVTLAFGAAYVGFKNCNNAVLFAASVAALLAKTMAIGARNHNAYGELILRERSFFGVSKVYRADADEGPVHILVHGAIVHNLQLRTPEGEKTPLAYYSFEGPFGQVIAGLRRLKGSLKVASVGLGAGALACHGKAGEDWTFYEIDPHVADIARDDRWFSYLARCAPAAPIKIGDARLALAAEQRAGAPKVDLIVVDAFSSDSIPAHLITREALALYRDRLTSDGIIFFHTSNRYLDVVSVASRIAADAGLQSRVIRFEPETSGPLGPMISRASAVVVGSDAVVSKLSEGHDGWLIESPSPYVGVWTDDYSNILGAMAAKFSNDQQARIARQQAHDAFAQVP
jgi:hypothetical protein